MYGVACGVCAHHNDVEVGADSAHSPAERRNRAAHPIRYAATSPNAQESKLLHFYTNTPANIDTLII